MKKRSLCFIALMCVMALLFQGCSMLGMGSLFGTELTPTELYYSCAYSVVEIRTEAEGGGAVGSGFFCDKNGTVITNYHVIEGFAKAKVYLLTGEEYEVKSVKGYDIKKDIAVLETDCKDSIPLQFSTAGTLTGDKVYTIGSSLGMTSTLSEGIVSCALREICGQLYIQTTAPISPGNSGGPLFDAYGNVIGVNTMTFAGGQNVNLAVPIEEALNVSVSNPTTLETLFTRVSSDAGRARKLENWSIGYESKDDSRSGKEVYSLWFQLRDQEGGLVKTDGHAQIRIVNDDDVTVYTQTLSFEQNDTVTVKNRDGEFEFMAVEIPIEDIEYGDTYFGVLYFSIGGWDYTFEEVPLRLLDLPVM